MGELNSDVLSTLDWVAIGCYFAIVIVIGLLFMRRAGKSTDDFFVAGRSLPWWIAGTSLVATMFAADTPLFHTGNVRHFGLDAGWLFFAPSFGVILASVLFARLWRRTRVVTDVELLELRYSGKAATVFRGFNAVYGGVFKAALTMGWVTLAMGVVVEQFLGLSRETGTWLFLGIVLVYSAGSGMWGVVMTDLVQYVIATAGSIFLAWKAIAYCGGLEAMNTVLVDESSWTGATEGVLRVLPDPSAWDPSYTWWLVVGFILVWGADVANSGGFIGQRVYACRNEKHASHAVLWFGFCYYVLNGWPWIIIGAASIHVLGATNAAAGLGDYQETFPAMIMKLMPPGLRGLMVASLIAAFMSTIDTLLNWGSSLLVNDCYRRFLNTNASRRHYVMVSRAIMLGLAVFGGWFALQFESITAMLMTVNMYLVGGFVVYMLRWLWSRANIWAEIAAMIGSLIIALFVQKLLPEHFGIWQSEDSFQYYGQQMTAILAGTTIVWIVVALFTKPTEDERLIAFYKQSAPPGPGWARIRRLCGDAAPRVDSPGRILATWAAGVVGLVGALAAIGFVVTCRLPIAAALFCVALVATFAYFKLYNTLRQHENAAGHD